MFVVLWSSGPRREGGRGRREGQFRGADDPGPAVKVGGGQVADLELAGQRRAGWHTGGRAALRRDSGPILVAFYFSLFAKGISFHISAALRFIDCIPIALNFVAFNFTQWQRP
eukprot:scaffold24928_cov17-Prasinocladus_malaysianus.AAC.2